jgi:hypothetical protein
MKALLILFLIVLVAILFAVFGPTQKQPKPVVPPAQPTTAAQPAVAPAVTPVAAQPLSPRQRGELSTPAAATGVTTETVNIGGGGAVFEAKRRMTEKIDQVSPSGGKR